MSKRLRYAEEQKKKWELKLLFKKVVRQVILNTPWLDEDNDDGQIFANAGKNIENLLLVRTKRKSEMLTAKVIIPKIYI